MAALTSTSPDVSSRGMTAESVDAGRYDGAVYDPCEPSGLLNAMMPSGVRVLDVGCGTGVNTLLANQGRDNHIVGIEPDSERAGIARSRGLDVHTGLLEGELQAALGTFDVVMSVDVLEHTVAPAAFLETIRGSLRPGGLLLLSVPNVAHWSVRWMLLWGRFDYEAAGIMDATHLRWFTAATLVRLLQSQNFEVLQLSHSVGTGVSCNERPPLKYLPPRLRRRLLMVCTRLFPRLFGVQHVVKARLRA